MWWVFFSKRENGGMGDVLEKRSGNLGLIRLDGNEG